MTENSSPKPIQTMEPTIIQQQNPSTSSNNNLAALASPCNSIDIPQITSLQQQQQQQNNLMAASNFQIQRSPSMSRLNQIQQQQQYNLAAGIRQQAAVGISGQMSFGGNSQLQQQNNQQQQMGQIGNANLTRSALMGQTGHLPMLPAQAAAAQLNLQSQLLASV